MFVCVTCMYVCVCVLGMCVFSEHWLCYSVLHTGPDQLEGNNAERLSWQRGRGPWQKGFDKHLQLNRKQIGTSAGPTSIPRPHNFRKTVLAAQLEPGVHRDET